MKPVEISPRAAAALEGILAWYEERRPGLARTCLRDLRHVLELLESFPEAGRAYRGSVRTLRLGQFPYRVVYREEPARVLVLQIVHMRRGGGA